MKNNMKQFVSTLLIDLVILIIAVSLILYGLNSLKHLDPAPAVTTEVQEVVTQVALPLLKIDSEELNVDTVAEMINIYKIKQPHIVLAQAIHETGRFSSKVFKENHNLFGLKVPYARPTTAIGTKNGHAYYSSWKMSVLDYALFQAAYMNKLKSERRYLSYLNRNYAEDPHYDIRLKDYFKETKSKFK